MRPLFLAATLLASAGSLTAAAVNVTFIGVTPGTASNIERLISDSTTGSQNWTLLGAGLLAYQRTGGDYTNDFNPGPGGYFLSFCIEPQEFAGSAVFTVVGLPDAATNLGGIGPTRAAQVNRLLSTYFPDFGGPIDDVQAAALQIAIWEIVRENSGSLNITGGTTQFRNPSAGANVLTLAQSYLNTVAAGGGSNSGSFIGLNAVGRQDLVVQVVPEPSTWTMIGLSALPLIAFARRKRKS